jgi:hypothetical protein
VQKAGVLDNPEAHAYYREHSASYQTYQRRNGRWVGRSVRAPVIGQAHSTRIDPDRNVDRARRRYMQASKADLVERLLEVEQEYAQAQQQLARLQFALLEAQQAKAAVGHRQPAPRRDQH